MLEFFRSASRFAGALLRRTLTIFRGRRTVPLAPDPARKVEVSAAARPEGPLEPPSAMGMARGEPDGMGNVAEIAGVSATAHSNMGDMASASIVSTDAKPINAAREHVPNKSPHSAPGEELAQAAEAETGRQGRDAAEAAASLLPQEPEGPWPAVEAHPPPAESAGIARAACAERAPPLVTAEIANEEACLGALVAVDSAAPPTIDAPEILSPSPDTADAYLDGCANEPGQEPASDPASRCNWPDGANEDDTIIPPSGLSQLILGDAGGTAITGMGTAGDTLDADAPPNERIGITALAPSAPPDDGIPAVMTFDLESDAIEAPRVQIGSDVDDATSSGPERSAPAPGVGKYGPEPGPIRPPIYRPRLERSRIRREPRLPSGDTEREYQDLEADLRLLFGPGDWGIELSALLRQPAGAEEVEVLEGGEETWLGALDDRLLEPLALADGARVLSEGLSIEAIGLPVRWHRSSREIHIFGEHPSVAGFVSQPRVAIGRENVVVCRDELAGVALAQIAATGGNAPTRIDGPGVPAGWLCWRGIRPARPSAPQGGLAILHALDPLPAVSIDLPGGLRLARGTWLEGHPPSIRLLGLLEFGESVRIDGRPASIEGDGTWTAEGWDRLGSHRIEYGGITAAYEIEPGTMAWDWWPAWDGQTALAGALASANGKEYFQTDPYAHLIGAMPGEICSFRPAVGGIYVARPEFAPVWLLARTAGMRNSKPALIGAPLAPSAAADAGAAAIIQWARTVCSVGRAGAHGSAERRLWDQYLAVAKRKRRRPR
ncbi:hypothetical protein FJ938_14455 [Mesorhizobium sp. B2-4-14]|uniref:hypothetical protein n=1 Tax=Mesorhizobium sp. B2-4-14 TaxID=2589935 RepID=UPI00112B6D65|nr:hypothetical protein [Mesorhizobium sp. B2-4-14]TPL05813.1 hypothetical protein FJ938_14455 [Mesorhizobium sp. B2-4-14]